MSSLSSSSSQLSLPKKGFRNILGYDLLVDFFYAALYSNNVEYLCDPFPKEFLMENNEVNSPNLRYRKKNLKDIRRAKSTLDGMGKLNKIENPEDNIFLNWIMNSEIQLKRVSKVTIENGELINGDSVEDLSLSNSSLNSSKSSIISTESLNIENHDLYTYIFKVNYINKNNHDGKLPRCIQHNIEFEKLKKEYGSFYGYHGSAFENFHSILHHGLLTNLNKRDVYGKGIYVSIDYHICFNFSKSHLGRGKKSLIGKGNPISVIALCEIIKHPDIMNKQNNDGALFDEPEEYYVIKNNAHIRVTHLLVYANRKSNIVIPQNKFITFIHDHFLILIFVLYFLLMYYLGNR